MHPVRNLVSMVHQALSLESMVHQEAVLQLRLLALQLVALAQAAATTMVPTTDRTMAVRTVGTTGAQARNQVTIVARELQEHPTTEVLPPVSARMLFRPEVNRMVPSTLRPDRSTPQREYARPLKYDS